MPKQAAPRTQAEPSLPPHHRVRLLRGQRARLANSMRRHALAERGRRLRGGVVEFESIRARDELYELIARRLEDRDAPVDPIALGRLRKLLTEEPRSRDYFARAEARDARVASILGDLERS